MIDAGDPQSGNRSRFRFALVSGGRASGRGEAVSACERAVFPNAGAQDGKKSSGPGCSFCVFVAIYMGFKLFSHGLLLCSWAF